MRRRIALVLLALTACGEDEVDLTGVYRVDSQVASMPCGMDAPVAMPAAYVKLTASEVFGGTIYSLSECADDAGMDCTGGGLFGGTSFSQPIDGGWAGDLYGAFSGGNSDPTCTLEYTRSTAVLAGARLTVEVTTYTEDVDNTDALCDSDEAQRRADAMPCGTHELTLATRL